MSDLAGSLDISLRWSSGEAQCRIVSTRPLGAASAFVGRTAQDTLARLPALFSVCSRAQAAACVRAFEQASGIVPHSGARSRRRAAIAAETVREHLWRILLDWPTILGEPSAREVMAAVLSKSNRLLVALDPSGDLFQPGGGASSLSATVACDVLHDLAGVLEQHVFGMPPDVWVRDMRDAWVFEDWCTGLDRGPARLLSWLLETGQAALGSTRVAALEEIEDSRLAAWMSGEEGKAFVARPTIEGRPRETSPFTRGLSHPLIRSLIQAHGPGLLARLGAQLLEVADQTICLSDEAFAIREQAEGLGRPNDHRRAPAMTLGEPPLSACEPGEQEKDERTRCGVGRAQAARGLLVHLVRLADGRVSDYRILAPTEWNFHPGGVVAQALASLEPGPDPARVRQQAGLLITAIDPCVSFNLTLA